MVIFRNSFQNNIDEYIRILIFYVVGVRVSKFIREIRIEHRSYQLVRLMYIHYIIFFCLRSRVAFKE